MYSVKRSISQLAILLFSAVCRPRHYVYLTGAFALWTTVFGLLTLISQSRDTLTMSKDYRGVRELLYPPVEVSRAEHALIREMISQLEAAGFLNEPRTNIFDGRYPKWPFSQKRGGFLIPQNNVQYNREHLGEKFAFGARQFFLYDPEEIDVDQLLDAMSRQPIYKIEEVVMGTQLKLKMFLHNYGKAMFKPMRYDRSYETSPNQYYFSDYERHNAEIATFHLDRLLGWYRAPPVVGRMVNVSSDLLRLAPPKLQKTFFESPAKNWCFYGHCKYYCDTTNAFCGNPFMLEGSLATFLPPEAYTHIYKIRSPWRRSYNKHKLALWEKDNSYCEGIDRFPDFSQPRRLLDLVDTHVLDFITGNMDRHHYLFYKGFKDNNTFHLHFDHGRAFGRINHDELSILSPLTQCCVIRYTTLYKLVTFYAGDNRLSALLKKSLSRDPVAPVLAEGHYAAVDRRVSKILTSVAQCLHNKSTREVVINDGF